MDVARPDRRKAPRPNDAELRGRRAEPRARIVFPASVEALSGRQQISLVEVSRAGARLEGADLPVVGKGVILRCGDIDAFGTVIWLTDGHCGIEFDEPISTRELVAMRRLAVAAERSFRSPEEIQAAADWMNGLAR